MFISLFIFILTLWLIIFKPYNLKIGTSAVFGAVLALSFGVVSFQDTLEIISIVWDATLSFIGIIMVSLILEKNGFFEWCAIKMAKFSNGSGRLMFIYTILLGSIVSAFFANDGAALILTPIILSKMKILKLNLRTMVAFLLASGFIADSASLLFVFSNLTNIMAAGYFQISFGKYFLDMILPFFVSVFISTSLLLFILYKDIPKSIDTSLLKPSSHALKSKKFFKISWVFLIFLMCSYFLSDILNLPLSIFALSGAFIFMILGAKFEVLKPSQVIKEAPWQIVWFSIGLFVVVYGLKNAGLMVGLDKILEYISYKSELFQVLGVGFIAAFMSAFMNNLPTILMLNISLDHIDASNLMIYANIIGCNIGTKLTPFGSLATLLWLFALEKDGVKIGVKQYMKFGFIITPPVLFMVLLSLLFI
ncbi:arsenic transporter [Campylobacter corcagiensis]|uniref:Arsenical pump membrane protein n=1 Tax=Campylobacter corcagiensis TaxID=1448857 RepID=A0A7M1LIB0_9BACT|nr:arsenic transporter [Campylobacter corcagiensis]QOQ88103.1 arsenic transporter [Campylobacter corcagiensis]